MGLVSGARTVRAASKQRRRVTADTAPHQMVLPVTARLVGMDGACARKIQYALNDEFTFEGKKKVTPKMCGPAFHGLLPYVQMRRSGENGHEARVQCTLPGSILLFKLVVREPAGVA